MRINNTDLSQGKWSCYSTIARGKSCTSYKIVLKQRIFNKLNHHLWVAVGGNQKVFGLTNLGMRVHPSLLVTYDKGCLV